MSEEVNESVEETQEVTAQTDQSTEHNDVSQEAQEAKHQKRNDAEYNFAEMRRQQERDREEREELRREIAQLKKPPVEEDDYTFADDDLVEGKYLKDLKKEIKSMKSEMQRREVSSMEDRMALKYPDYKEVTSKENIGLLIKTRPALAKALGKMQDDPFDQAEAAYEMLKGFTAKQSDPNALERKKAAENSQKPLSANAVTKNSAIGNAHLFENGLTKELKDQLWKEMQAAKRAG